MIVLFMGNNLDFSTVLSFNFFLFLFLNEKKKCVFFVTFFAQAKKIKNKNIAVNINLSVSKFKKPDVLKSGF